MDLKRFEFLCQIADYGSFSKAAAVVGMTQPSLGRQIRRLEKECGTVLLYRNGRGASLTPEGAALLERVRPLLREIDSAVADLQSDHRVVRGTVSIGMTPALSRIVGFRLLAAVKKSYPRVALNIVTGYSGYLLEWLTTGRIDVGILDNARRSDHLIFDHLAQLRLSLVSAKHTVPVGSKGGQTIRVSALKSLPLVLPTRNHGLRRTMDLAAVNAGIRLNIPFEIDAHDLVREIVLAGQAHTIMSALAVQAEIEQGRLTTKLLTPAVTTRLLCGTSANRPVTAAARVIIKLLQDMISELGLQPKVDSKITVKQ